MKKMLTMLFLLFCLTTSGSLVNSNEVDSSKKSAYSSKMTVYKDVIADRIEEEVNVAYHTGWDSIPVLSPVKMRNIKYISSDYGHRRHPILHSWGMHHGIDFAAKKGTTVYSTAKGTVTKVKYSRRGYGNEVVITHADGYSTRYAHLDQIYVEIGQRVQTYTYLGTIGSTGLSTGSHLHYEVLRDNRPIDPMFFTYDSWKDRSIGKYFESLIALEGQQYAEKNLTLGMYYKFSTEEQVLSSS